jgi:hypothetical protein
MLKTPGLDLNKPGGEGNFPFLLSAFHNMLELGRGIRDMSLLESMRLYIQELKIDPN